MVMHRAMLLAALILGAEEAYNDHNNFMQVANRGGLEALALDAAARLINPGYGQRVAAHEAAHFLIAYLLGLLPKRYILSSVDAFQRCVRACTDK